MGIYNAVSKANDLVAGAVGIASTKKEFIAKQSINFVLLFVVLLVFGCLDFATLQFHLEYITTPSYWERSSQRQSQVFARSISVSISLWTPRLRRTKSYRI